MDQCHIAYVCAIELKVLKDRVREGYSHFLGHKRPTRTTTVEENLTRIRWTPAYLMYESGYIKESVLSL